MQQDRWNRIQAIFDAALEFAGEDREHFLAKECAGDTALREELRALLAADAHSDELWNQLAPNAMATPPTSAKAPQQVGPYRILDKIGAGGMGVIYRARDTRLQRDVALKFLPAHLHTAPQARERFLAEARAASRLDHPNICVIHDIGETPDAQLYLTMPFYQGGTLEMRIARGPLPEDEVVDIFSQVAVGLSAAHAHEIVHRDIKPANIMLTRDRGVKILDFGVAKMAGVDMTSAGMSIGTVAYMAPEQLRGEQADARADIWALGVTLHEALTGNRPFSGQRIHEVIRAVLLAGSSPIPAPPTEIAPGLWEIICRALASEPDARYPSAEALLADLAEIRRPGARPDDASGRGRGGDDAARWDSPALDELIAEVTPQIGPIAPVLIKRLAQNVRSLPELYERLADHLPDETARAAFLKRVRSNTTPIATLEGIAGQPRAPAVGVSAAPQLERIEAALKPMLGPITATLIRRQSANCTDLAQLCQILADYLPSDRDKARFLQMTAALCK